MGGDHTPTRVERYMQGDCQRVWAELVQLGARVRAEPLYAEALAVARETMRRARHNIELLVERLPTVGYEFGLPQLPNQLPPFAPAKPDAQERIAMLEQVAGPLPLSLRAWYEVVDSVNFVGSMPELEARDPDLAFDPLVVESVETNLASYAAWHRDHEALGAIGPFTIAIAVDAELKYGTSGAGEYEVEVPDLAADGRVQGEWHETTFVKYLRICFRYACLPPLEGARGLPSALLQQATEGLLPI